MREQRQKLVLATVGITKSLFGVLPLGDVQQHIDAAGQLAAVIEQRHSMRLEPAALACGSLCDRLSTANRARFFERERHRRLLVAQRRAIAAIEPPGDTPAV